VKHEVRIDAVAEGPLLDEVRTLFREYADSLPVDLSFQDFARELAGLPGEYAPPAGVLLLAHVGAAVAGCLAVHAWRERACEMKRLFVRDAFHGHGLGRTLAERAIGWARAAGYERMLLDTLPSMTAAQRLYEQLGFRDVPPYRFNPIAGSRFLELRLQPPRGDAAGP
jgi:putative acetyltransferase